MEIIADLHLHSKYSRAPTKLSIRLLGTIRSRLMLRSMRGCFASCFKGG